jgi:hypothetical protein
LRSAQSVYFVAEGIKEARLTLNIATRLVLRLGKNCFSQNLRCCIIDGADEDENATGVTPSLYGRCSLHDWRLETSVQEIRNPKRGH